MRAITHKTFNLRKWQREAFDILLEHYKQRHKSFLAVATPGAGKTKFALSVAHYMFTKNIINRIVIVVPSEHLKTQWAIEASSFAGIDITPDFKNSHHREGADYHGIAVTYALLGMDKQNVHAQATFNSKTLVILDEVHHAGENKTWGDAIQNAFNDAVMILCLSGTPFRSDSAQIPFITYENGESRADYAYDYDQALKDGVVRPIYFPIVHGVFNYRVGDKEFSHTFSDYIADDLKSKRLRAALEAEGGFVYQYLNQAHEKLIELRKTHAAAGGLIVAMNQDHARKIARVLQNICRTRVPIAVSDDANSHSVIKDFANSDSPWLVSVRMVSEGVDIPRLRVGGFLTNVKKELFFRQLVGRFVRMMERLGSFQDAFVFIPADKDFIKLAQHINEQRDHVLKDCSAPVEPLPDLFGNRQPALQGDFEVISTEATTTRTIGIAVSTRNSSGIRRRMVTIVPDNELPIFEQERRIRDQINRLAKLYAMRLPHNGKPDFRAAHNIWMNEQGGTYIENEGLARLKERLAFVENLLRRLAS